MKQRLWQVVQADHDLVFDLINRLTGGAGEPHGSGEAEHLADLYLAARSKAPTRPHPHTPPLPSVLGSLGVLMAGMDRARDALTGRQVPSP